ncbi:hypothetical protein QQF64_030557 [Cirrhinus molitorella]|uniref:Uncharacterized protein n=1 Tax=Cirrhinus molitorella TaxID=172907 RepID=A0ABR3N3U6_9TELE
MKEMTGRKESRGVERKREKLCHRQRIGQQSDGTVACVVAAPLPGSLHTQLALKPLTHIHTALSITDCSSS